MSSRRDMFSLVSASNLASCAALMAWIWFAMVPGGASRWDGFVLDEGDFGLNCGRNIAGHESTSPSANHNHITIERFGLSIVFIDAAFF